MPFHQERDGVWRAVIDLPICRRFEFRYLIDGVWATDLYADDLTPNAHGSFNSVVNTDPLVVHPDRSLGHGTVREQMATQTGRIVAESRPAHLQETDATLRAPVARPLNRQVRRIKFGRATPRVRRWRWARRHHRTAIVIHS